MKDYQIHKSTNPYLDIVRSHTKPYTTEVLGKEIVVFPNVMSPHYDISSSFAIECFENMEGKSVLDMGTGTGILGLFAAMKGAVSVDAIDINPHAIDNAQYNFQKYQFNPHHFKAFYSNIFSKIHTSYDTILFNPPFHGNKPHDILEKGVSDENYMFLTSFFEEVGTYFSENSEIYLVFSDTGDVALLHSLISGNGLITINRWERYIEDGDWTCFVYRLMKK